MGQTPWNPGSQATTFQSQQQPAHLESNLEDRRMFSCCMPRKPWCGCLIGAWRRWINAHPGLQRLGPFFNRNPNETNRSPEQVYSVQDETESIPTQEGLRRVSTVEPDMLEKMVSLLIPLYQKEDPFFVPAFLFTYRRFTTTGQVLELLFQRYAYFQPDCEEDEQVKNTMCSLLAMWLDKYPEDFCQINNLSNLNKLMAYVLLNMPSSELAVRVHLLLTELETKEADKKRKESLGRWCLRTCEEGWKLAPME
ncbi:ral guanine nucleotide dissociation stimulator-like [Dipodomys spectabilis]|uniref:ral guanine nucleotide dissociation stimulator-like n=1 Tax=Dipodomys spectabilis TaxID=105255 RepID=UPI001C53E70B|nr:ral guanine nucleotide dissociation stimulator-like [Dipodomys spectabilis]